jgi:hypothetical protein
MAARRNAKPETAPAETAEQAPSGGLAVQLRRSEGVKRAPRAKEVNPLLDHVRASLEEGPLAFDVANEEDAKKAASLLQRAATELGVGLAKSISANGDGTYAVDFEAKNQKREHNYTAKDIREWYERTFATDAGPAKLTGPISKEIRHVFRVANGYEKGNAAHLDRTFTNE